MLGVRWCESTEISLDINESDLIDEEIDELPAGKSLYFCTECRRYFVDIGTEDLESAKKGQRRICFRTVKLSKQLEVASKLMNTTAEPSVCDPCMLGEIRGKA
jgi:hypothetical protein